MNLTDQLLKKEASRWHSDADHGIPTFSVIYDDPESGTYAVQVRYYVDADRAGFCDYVTEIVYDELDQVEADEIVKKLTKFKNAERKAEYVKYGLKLPAELEV
jgi:hypothetical protein